MHIMVDLQEAPDVGSFQEGYFAGGIDPELSMALTMQPFTWNHYMTSQSIMGKLCFTTNFQYIT